MNDVVEPQESPATLPTLPPRRGPSLEQRAVAALEIVIVTLGVELAVDGALVPFLPVDAGFGQLGASGLALLVLVKNLLIPVTLIAFFLRRSGGGLRDLGFGRRRPLEEVMLGLVAFLPMAWCAAIVVQVLLHWYPQLDNVKGNPLLDLIGGPGDAAWFILASVFAGGLGEETVRAFILRRFERYLGGMATGLVVWSVGFGLFHVIQGLDKAVAVGVLGLLLGLLYAWRRDPLAPIVAHAAFNVFQVLMAWLSAG